MSRHFSLAVVFLLALSSRQVLCAPTLSCLKSFGTGENSAAVPCSTLIYGLDGFFYGTSSTGGALGGGTVFRIAPDGTGLLVLHSFGGTGTNAPAEPYAGVIEASDGYLYGTTERGGTNGLGTVFRLGKEGGSFSILKSFGGGDGAYPEAELMEASDGRLYGATTGGGLGDQGVLFSISKDGASVITLRQFDGTNGASPTAALVEGPDGALYGTTYSGGRSNLGVLFRTTKDGAGFSILRQFSNATTNGARPVGRLCISPDGSLYGTTSAGGTNRTGTVFKIGLDGNGFTLLHHFGKTSSTDGRSPFGHLALGTDGRLYGTTSEGGTNGLGTVFGIDPDGNGYRVLHSFSAGSCPVAGLTESPSGLVYGTTERGGDAGDGTVFSLEKDGGGFVVRHSFSASGGDGTYPAGEPALGNDGTIYGTLQAGGPNVSGGVFALTRDGQYRIISWQGLYSPGGGLEAGPDDRLYGIAPYGWSGYGGVFAMEPGTGNLLWAYNTDYRAGTDPRAGVLLASDGMLYGTTVMGGTNGQGTLYRMSADGTGYQMLYHFSSGFGNAYNNQGANPTQRLIEGKDGALYGVTYSGGRSNNGVVFKFTKGGSYTMLKWFGNAATEGANPSSPLLQASNGLLYGTTYSGGGARQAGTVYRLATNGTGFAVVYRFTGNPGEARHPCGPLVEGSDGAIYGTTQYGGPAQMGTVYKVQKSGTAFEIVAQFGGIVGERPPFGLVTDHQGVLYGTSRTGGQAGLGALFMLASPPEERIESAQFAEGFRMICSGLGGTSYHVERASKLGPTADWETVFSTNAPGAGKFEFVDPSPPTAGAFYRLRR
jgi:uncharacterized repeat protein (TIGR03803 family)